MFLKFAPLFVLMGLTLVSASGCLSLPVTSRAELSGSREPVLQMETAVAAAATATATGPVSPLPTATAVPTPAPTAAPTATEPASPLPAATVATATAAIGAASPSPAPSPEAGHYRGPNPYRAKPAFEVTYDPARWEYVEDDGSGRQSQLKHRTINGCAIWLRAGPVDGKKVADAWAADRAWSVVQVRPDVIQYVSPQNDFAWIFGILLGETYTGRASSQCQDAATMVIDTFKVVQEP